MVARSVEESLEEVAVAVAALAEAPRALEAEPEPRSTEPGTSTFQSLGHGWLGSDSDLAFFCCRFLQPKSTYIVYITDK